VNMRSGSEGKGPSKYAIINLASSAVLGQGHYRQRRRGIAQPGQLFTKEQIQQALSMLHNICALEYGDEHPPEAGDEFFVLRLKANSLCRH